MSSFFAYPQFPYLSFVTRRQAGSVAAKELAVESLKRESEESGNHLPSRKAPARQADGADDTDAWGAPESFLGRRARPRDRRALLFLRRHGMISHMRCVTMEAEIDHGRVIPKEPEKLPSTGKALLTVLSSSGERPDWDKVIELLGTMQNKADGLAIEREARAEWDARSRSQE